MIVATISRLVSAYFAFLLPAYNTWKALAHKPASQDELERLAIFWVVVGGFTAIEMTTEWLYSWFPFYWEIKTLFLLFLSLPQTQGSSWVYQQYISPYLTKNEAKIDRAIAEGQASTVTFVQNRFAVLWDTVLGLLNKGGARPPQQQQAAAPGAPAARHGQPGTGASGAPAAHGGTGAPQVPSQAAMLSAAAGLWSQYGPAVMGAINRSGASTNANSQASAAPAQASGQSFAAASAPTTSARPAGPDPRAGTYRSSSSQSGQSGQSTPAMDRGLSSGYQARPDARLDPRADPRQVPLPPSGAPTPLKNPKSPPVFPEPKHYRA